MIYIAHPYSGKEENKNRVEEIIKQNVINNPGITFVSPIHAFGYMYEFVDYTTGINMCLDLLSKCNRIYVYGDYRNSKCCMIEIKYAIKNHIPITFKPEVRDA